MIFRVEHYDDVSSTNTLIKERIDAGEPEGLAVRAKTQNGGYGRRGNLWSSPEGGLYMSFLLRPDVSLESLSTLPHVCAIAARRAIVEVIDPEKGDFVKIKWPNDIVYTGPVELPEDSGLQDVGTSFKKICGISVEHRNGAICVGIGINVLNPQNASNDYSRSPENIKSVEGRKSKNIPVYLEDLVSTDKMATVQVLEDALLESLDDVYSKWRESQFLDLREEYLEHFALEGFKARIDDDAHAAIECEVVGINDCGNLEVIPIGETEIKTIAAGTVRAL